MGKEREIIFSETAKQAVVKIALYIAEQGFPDNALKFTQQLIKFGYSLQSFPYSFPECRNSSFKKAKFRCAIFQKDYLFLYRVYHKKIIIQNIIHCRAIN
jgi:plasmid stabilization system protein ParE